MTNPPELGQVVSRNLCKLRWKQKLCSLILVILSHKGILYTGPLNSPVKQCGLNEYASKWIGGVHVYVSLAYPVFQGFNSHDCIDKTEDLHGCGLQQLILSSRCCMLSPESQTIPHEAGLTSD